MALSLLSNPGSVVQRHSFFMRINWLTLILALLPAPALYATTTVSQQVLDPAGNPATGQATIAISQACRSGSTYVGQRPIYVSFTAGNFSVKLVPNDSCVPSGSYAVSWALSGGQTWKETWLVPTSPTPVTIDSVVVQGVPPPSLIIQWSQMGQNGAVIGDAPLWNGSVWLPGVPSGGVPSVFGRTGAVTAQSGDYNTSQVPENTNLYFTPTRAQAALAGMYQSPITGAPGTWPSFAPVATSGAYADLTGKPILAAVATSGVYNDLTGRPTFATVATSGAYSDLSGKPNLATVATTGAYGDLTGKPTLAAVATSGAYSDLTGAPAVPAAGSATPIVNGTGAAGSSANYSRQDHVHPTDTSRQAALGFTPENAANRNIANGYAPLDAAGLLPAANLPATAVQSTSANTLLLTHFLGDLNNTAVNVVLIGDSETQGYYASNRFTESWAGLVTASLQANYGNRGTGTIPVYNTNYAWSAAGSWTASTTIGPYQSGISSSVFSATGTGSAYSSTVAYSLNNLFADSFQVITYTASDSGNCAISIDGQPATVLVHASTGTAAPVSDTVSANGLGYHNIAVGPNGSAQKCYFFGVVPTVGSTGVVVHNLGLSGTATSFFSATGSAGGLGFLSLLSPDLVIVSIGINDFNTGVSTGTFTANYTAILNAVQATSASIVILGEPPNSTTESGGSVWPAYRAALQTLAVTYSAVYLDVYPRWQSYAYANARGYIFTNHPSTAGHNDIANYVISSLFPLAAMSPQAPSPASSSPGVAVTSPAIYAPSTDLVCAYGGDVTIGKKAVSAATIAANAVVTVAATTDYMIGSLVNLSGFADSGWNGTYTVTAAPSATQITINLNSGALTFTGAGSPIISLVCTNSSDSNVTTQQTFRTTIRIPANTFGQRGKRLRIDAVFKLWNTANVSSTLPMPRFKVGAATAYLPVGYNATNISGSQSGQSLPAHFGLTLLSAPGTTAAILGEGFLPLPGWTNVHTQNGNPTYQQYDTTAVLTVSIAMGYGASGAGGTIAYSSGGSATGSGFCLATANGTTVPASDFTAIGLITVTGGTISGNLLIGPQYPQTNSGVAYTAIPTTWGLSLPSSGAASTCSGTITTSGGTIVGAMGNAMQLVMLAPTWMN